nr:HAD family hydrolase [bacterium]
MPCGIQKIMFDMDGTLTDTAKATVAACREVAPRFGMVAKDAAFIQSLIGWANPVFYHKMYPEIAPEELVDFGHAVEREESNMIARIGEGMLFDGVKDMLVALKQKGYRLYIASTGSPEHVAVSLRAGGIAELFEKIGCGQPDKEAMVGELLADTPPQAALMVGDRQKDIAAARANGIRALGAGFGYCLPEDAPLYDAVLTTPQALVDYVLALDGAI